MGNATVRRVIRAYDAPIVRAYCWARFGILRQRFLDQIGDHLPRGGDVLDIGCGFGLFSLYFAAVHPALRIHGIDLSRRRIAMASRAASRLGLGNVRYQRLDARELRPDRTFQGAYMLDIVHHIEPGAVAPLLACLRRSLAPGATLVVKDVDRHPAAKRLFTWALDKVLAPCTPVRYWGVSELTAALVDAGFAVRSWTMADILPYPHVLYVCRAPEGAP
jgi:2-polyprenyl-3-methyl-5-hydroxy-6-metoxy-1,4-benzoquinol methylase